MNRENLVALCARWVEGGDRVVVGRVTVAADLADPVPEIMRSFRRAEEVGDCCAETACVRDEWADEHEASGDDD
jgi:hypothetical protein